MFIVGIKIRYLITKIENLRNLKNSKLIFINDWLNLK